MSNITNTEGNTTMEYHTVPEWQRLADQAIADILRAYNDRNETPLVWETIRDRSRFLVEASEVLGRV